MSEDPTPTPTVIVVEIKPYRERRRTRKIAAALIAGACLWGYIVAPALADLAGDFLERLGIEDEDK